MKILNATIDDLDTIVNVGKQTFLDAYGENTSREDMDIYLKSAFNKAKILQQFNNSKSRFFLLKLDTNTIGYIKLRWDRTTAALDSIAAIELERLYLLKRYYGHNYGSEALQFCIKYAHAHAHAFKWIWLLVWCENKGGIRFYERHGFEQFATKMFTFGNSRSEDFLLKRSV